MKKFLSLLLAVMMLLGCIPAMAEAGTFTANAKTYMITSYKGTDENLVVPASVDGAPTPIIHDRTLNGAKKAVTLSFEEGVTQIRSMNIASMDITKLTLPSTLEVIASNNIYQTDKLTEVTVPAAVSYVGTLSFSYCDVLTKVTFTGLCPVFGPRPFVSTAKDLVVYVPDDQLDAYKAALPEGLNVQPSGKKAVDARVRVAESDFEFDAATGTIKKYTGTASYIEIPATIGGVQVKTIGQKAFYQHPFMTVVIIPEGVETLEMYSIFAGKGLYCVEFPSTLKTIGKNALWASELDSLTLPEGLETIGESAFASAINKIDELVIPDSVTSIGKEAFYSCMPVKVVIGANVQSLPEASFSTLHNVTEIVIRNKNGMTIDPKAFQSSKKGATITLMDGITEEVYNSYVEQLTVAYASAKVNQPELAASFPTLDAEAGAPFIGNWTAVAGKDVMGDFTNDYPVVTATLNPDGTANVILDGVELPSAWYVDAGYAFLAPVENGKADAASTYAIANIDENGRLVIDFAYAAAICEQAGMTYAAPARPEMPWPALDLSNGQYFVGTWQTADGSMTLTLNNDGTASSVEPGETPYALRWYADYGTAYVGETVNEAAQVTFDGTGNIVMKMGDQQIVLAPYVEKAVIEGADELLGDWYDDVDNKLTLVNNGTLTHTYSFDGWVDTYAWDVVDGAAVVTEGPWSGLPITLENGILIITNDEGIFQIFSRDGDLSAYYGEDDEDDMPEAKPIGNEGAAYFGAWKGEMFGMEVTLTLNQDGTCAMEMFGESEPGVWSIVDGKADVMGDEIYIDGDGNLVMPSSEMVFTKAGGAEQAPAAAAEIDYVPSVADDFIGGWICADDPTVQILLLENEANLIEGTECCTSTWAVANGVAEFDGMKFYITDTYTVGILDMDGEQVKFERGYVEKPKASATAPSDSGDDDEMTDEELLALLALFGQMAEGAEDAELPENLKPFVGTWHLVYLATGGLEGDLRAMGLTGQLELKADGTGVLSGVADDSGKWYDDEGTVRFGKADTPLVLLDGGFLRYGNQLAGYMVFSQDASATWAPAPVATPVPAPTAAPAAPVPGSDGSYVGKTFVLTSASTVYAGQAFPVDASAFGEYKVCFHEDGKVTFVQAGLELPGEYLKWSINADGAYVLTYAMGAAVIMEYVFTPADGALNMDYYGTLMTFTPAE